ncbi:MAG TPA: helix-turn-helix domain-containing protein [Sphingomonas sp.]|uniref:helix-turn-helix domain-containing protein n=1 Tax=Sphingomonas sp. TaxID=28214 RepID=UPI002BA13F55|nr:helix-turn-helix domain-containing protein [Sphingomonas sp.]HMI19155.1 helix-turn-helix domain-containing protein [Sphingomonas sp.]
MLADDPYRLNLASEAGRVREAGALGRSDVLVRLFDFLLQCSLESRAPKEIEIAQEVFGKGGGVDLFEDASVRVYIHRLRRKLQEFYSANPAAQRLAIPLGEYRLILTDSAKPSPGEAGAEAADAEASPPSARMRWWKTRRSWVALGLFAVVMNIVAWYVVANRQPASVFAAAERTAFWQPLVTSDHPTFIVIGDYFIFGEATNTKVERLVRDFGINSREDLDRYLMDNPKDAGRYVDLNLHYLPVSTAYALRELVPLAVDVSAHGASSLRLLTMSRITAERLKSRNIIYVGYFSGLGWLRDPLFAVSGFSVGSSYDELIDRATGHHFLSDALESNEGGTPRRDYGYLASMPGPAGNRILIVAGTRDAGVMQAAEVAADPSQLAKIAAQTGGADAFEALFEVRTIGNLNIDSTLVIARPLRAGGPWRSDTSIHQRFPDQSKEERAPTP